jgi:hypothetical protein
VSFGCSNIIRCIRCTQYACAFHISETPGESREGRYAPVGPDIHVVAPSSIDFPPLVEKERKRNVSVDDDDENVGMMMRT